MVGVPDIGACETGVPRNYAAWSKLREYVTPTAKKTIFRAQCIPDLIQPEEIAEVILFLASDASRAITGQEVLADRGWQHS